MRTPTTLALVLVAAALAAAQSLSAAPPPGKGPGNGQGQGQANGQNGQGSADKKGKVVASATGAGHLTQNTKLRTFSFSARETENGTDRGQAQLRNRGEANVPIHVRITCLHVVGDVAHMSGYVSKIKNETEPFFVVDSKVAFSVEDNGPTGDRISLVSFFGEVAELDCETALTSPTLVVEKGQVKVRP